MFLNILLPPPTHTTRTATVPIKNNRRRQLISKHCSASEYAFFFDTERVQLL